MKSRVVPISLIVCSLSTCFFTSPMQAQDSPLHARVDELIAQREFGPVAEQTDDAAFIRRVTLALVGRIPTRTEVESFLEDASPDKRAALVDRLFSSNEYAQHMAVVFDVMLMERRGGKHVKSEEFRSYLESAFRQNRSYLEIAREILGADGTDENVRAASAFYLERDVEPHLLTRDVGRVFYGIDLQCAQCHNHPLIDDYYQDDYYGLQAFFVRSSLFQADKKKPALIAEQATGEATFKSVFTSRESIIGPRAPQADELAEVTLKPTEQYTVAPAKNVRAVPTQSRREQLAKVVLESPSEAFNRNIANRLWAHLFGRGIVHPVDLHHSDNPPTHPQVLDLITQEFVASNYDIKWLLRELTLTKAYQRSFQLPEMQPSIENAKQRIEAARTAADVASQRIAEADASIETAEKELDEAVAAGKPFRDAEAAANKEVVEAQKARDTAQAKVSTRQQQIEKQQTEAVALTKSQEATATAVAALKDDKELAGALETIKKRVVAHNEELQKQQAALKTEEQAYQEAEKALQTKVTAADVAIAARIPSEEKIHKKRAEMFAIREQTQSLRQLANQSRADVKFLETIIVYGESSEQIETLTKTITEQQRQVSANEVLVTQALKNVTDQEVTLTAAVSAVSGQQKVCNDVSAALAAIQKTHATLADSIAKANEALESRPDDTIDEAIKLLSETLIRIDEDVKSSQMKVTVQEAKLQDLQATAAAVTKQVEQSKQNLGRLQQDQAKLVQQLATSRQTSQQTQSTLDLAWSEIVDSATARAHVAGLTPLTPEQLAISMLVATGQFERLKAAAVAKIEKEQPTNEDSTSQEGQSTRQKAIDAALAASLKGEIDKFVKLYGSASGQPQSDFFATPDQSLFAANGNEIHTWLNPAAGNLTERLNKTEDIQELARDLYVSLLSRTPTDLETADVQSYLANKPNEKPQAVQELCWGLLTSAEFRFQH